MAQQPSQFFDPWSQFLLSTGANLMGGQKTLTPQTTFGNIGPAFNQGMSAYQNAMILQEQMAEKELKRKEIEEKANLAQGQREATIKAIQESNQPDAVKQAMIAQVMAGDSPGAADNLVKFATPEPLQSPLGPKDYGQDVRENLVSLFGNQPGQEYTPEQVRMANLLADQDAMRRAQAMGGGKTPPSQQTFADVSAATQAEILGETMKASQGGYELMGVVNYTRQLSDAVRSGGTGQEQILALNTLAQNLGLPTIQSADENGLQEALQAAGNRTINILRKINPKDPQFTKPDLIFYEQQVASLSRTPEGRKLILDMLEAQAQRVIDYNEILTDIDTQMPGATIRDAYAEFSRQVKERETRLPELMERVRDMTQGQNGQPKGDVAVKRTGTKPDGTRVRELADGTMEQLVNGQWVRLN